MKIRSGVSTDLCHRWKEPTVLQHFKTLFLHRQLLTPVDNDISTGNPISCQNDITLKIIFSAGALKRKLFQPNM